MNLKKYIPNLFTLGNLLCGTLATVYAISGEYEVTALLVLIGIVLDFFDGFLARMLGVTGELGKQLDSLADMVTSGVVPGILMMSLIGGNNLEPNYFSYLGLLLTLAACYRLAKFNIDTRQSESFIGLPTPAMSLFVISLPLIEMTTDIQMVSDLINNDYVLIGITVLLSFLMNAELSLFSLKFKNFNLKKNWIQYVFLLITLIMIITLHYLSIPMIILLYVILSIVNTSISKKQKETV